MVEDCAPLLGISLPILVIAFALWLRHKNRESMQQTFRMALDKGQDLTPEIIDRLGAPKPGKFKDLRLGVIWLASAIAFVIFGQTIPDDEANQILAGIAAFPFFIGVGYLVLHFFTKRD